MKKKATILVILISIPFLSGCAFQQETTSTESVSVKNISAIELKQMLENKDFFLLDVHIPEQEHIEGTDVFIPFDQIAQNLEMLPEDRNTPLVVYCRSGNMSLTASQQLIELGYTNVSNLEGGTKTFSVLEELGSGTEAEVNELDTDETNEIADLNAVALVEEITDRIIPTGTPFYGDENISFDKPNESLKFFEMVDAYNGSREYSNTIILEGEELERYNEISPYMYCEFCCGPVMIENCGCNHSAAYRGIVKYLIKYYGDELTDDEIIEEQVKWKNLWFQKGAVKKELRNLNMEDLVSNEELNELLGMVGGC